MEQKNQLKILNKMFIVNILESKNGNIIVISDKEIVGKQFNQNKLQLDLTNDFYQGKEINQEGLKRLVKKAYILHLTGKKTIEFFKEILGLEEILTVEGIPHAEVYLIE